MWIHIFDPFFINTVYVTHNKAYGLFYTWYGLISLPPFSRMTKQIWGEEEWGGRRAGRRTNGADKGIFYFISLFGSDDRWAAD